MNVIWPEPRAQKLISSGAPEIETQPFMAAKPARRLAVSSEFRYQLLADRVTAGSNTGPDCRSHVLRPYPIRARQGAYRFDYGARSSTPPSGMNCGNGAAFRIG